ncbi:MAG: VWA domain-containing protein [Saprospiraceae bacterium]
MFRIESPYYFLLLLIAIVIYFIYPLLQNRAIALWHKLGNVQVLKNSFHQNTKINKLKRISFILCLCFAIISLVNPQFGQKKMKVKSENAEIIIALDVSQSMLADDIKPNRLSRAKIFIKQFTDRFAADKIGLISFAGNAYLQSPLTTDVATINLMASIADPNLASTQGTSLANAIDLAIKSYASKQGQHKLLILLTDGEDFEGEAINKAEEASKEGISIVCIPFGTEEGSTIPIQTTNGIDYKGDQEGNPVRTKPNVELLQQLCSKTGGILLNINQGNELFNKLQEKIKSIVKKEYSFQSFSEFETYYQWPLFLSIISLIAMIIYKEKEKL